MLNITDEGSKHYDVEMLKKIINGEDITVHHYYRNSISTHDYGKLIMCCNTLPLAELTHAFFRRLIIIPFDVIISAEKADVELADKLKKELPGILNWVLEVVPILLKEKRIPECTANIQALEAYKRESDSVAQFLQYLHESGCSKETTLTPLYNEYETFCKAEKFSSLGRIKFAKSIEKKGIKYKIIHNQKTYTIKL